MATYQFAHEFAMPVPLHALEPSSLEAVAAMEEYGRQRRLDRVMASIVMTHGQGAATSEPWTGEAVTSNARGLARIAEDAGFEVRVHEFADRCMVEGVKMPERMGFRAWWVRGGADVCSWHSPWRYEEQDDDRPVKMDAKKRVGLKGFRSTGMGRRRMVCVGSPQGLPITYTALKARLSAL